MAVSFNNIPGDLRVPLFYAEMDNSAANSGVTQLRSLLIGQVNDNIDVAGELILATRQEEVDSLSGSGSPLSEMFATFRLNNPMGEVWVLPVKITDGVAATGKIVVTSAPQQAGVLYLYVGDARVPVTVSSQMPIADINQAIVKAINERALPVSALVEADAVVVTAKFKGELGNDIQLSLNVLGSFGGEVTPNGMTVKLEAMTGGIGVPDLTSDLIALGDEPFEFLIHPFTDTGSLNSLRDLMNDEVGRWSYAKMLYGHCYSAKRGTVGTLTAFGRSFNNQHSTIFPYEQTSKSPIWKLAAAAGGRTSVFITNDPARPTQTGVLNGIMPPTKGKGFQSDERQTLLWSGIATNYSDNESVRLERAVTQYQHNAYGSPDDSYLDSETLHTSAYVIRYLRSIITSKYGRHKLANDGTKYGAGQAIVTPLVIKGELISAYKILETEGIVENAQAFKEHLIVERDIKNPNRVNVLFPPDYINQFRILGLLNQFRLQYQGE